MTEHFCTLFDRHFLPMGVALHGSLMKHCPEAHLWILCMDEATYSDLEKLSLANTTLIHLAELETPELLAVKPGRTSGEYCWTLSPFTYQAVFDRAPDARRVTYLDADLFFFDRPQILLDEFEASGKDVFITEHAFAPQYQQKQRFAGRFCVQFLTFANTPAARRIMRWWQERCVEWCFGRLEDGKYGDQKYLEQWPELFGESICICRQTDRTLAPWNAKWTAARLGNLDPVFYHFHSLRLGAGGDVRLYAFHRVGRMGRRLYDPYLAALADGVDRMHRAGLSPTYTHLPREWILPSLRRLIRSLRGLETFGKLPRSHSPPRSPDVR